MRYTNPRLYSFLLFSDARISLCPAVFELTTTEIFVFGKPSMIRSVYAFYFPIMIHDTHTRGRRIRRIIANRRETVTVNFVMKKSSINVYSFRYNLRT